MVFCPSSLIIHKIPTFPGEKIFEVNFFLKDSPIFDFHANFYDGRANIALELIYPCFGPFDKSNIHGFLCFTIFPEGGHLGRNDLGDPSFSLGPSNKTYQEENLKTPMNSNF